MKDHPVAKRGASTAAQRLRGLADSPAEQAEYAVAVVRTETDALALEAALRALAERPTLDAREPLARLYERLDAKGVRRDQGCHQRVGILKALRSIVRDEDRALLERAALTVEYLPPGRQDVAHVLRATALLTLDALDSELAAQHAVRLLFDGEAQPMSGEPAVTAARLLAAQAKTLPLYAYTMQREGQQAEALAECLRNLAVLPASLLAGLVERHGAPQADVILVGLFDLLLAHPAGQAHLGFVTDFLTTTRRVDVYRYVIMALLATRDETWLAALSEAVTVETDARKLEILDDALALRAGTPLVDGLLRRVRAKGRRKG